MAYWERCKHNTGMGLRCSGKVIKDGLCANHQPEEIDIEKLKDPGIKAKRERLDPGPLPLENEP